MIRPIRNKLRGRFVWIKDPIYQAYRRFAGSGRRSRTDWASVLARDRAIWEKAKQEARNGPHVLLGTTMGGGFRVWKNVEVMLAAALTLRGARVHLLQCDCRLPACMMWMIGELDDQQHPASCAPPGPLCNTCHPDVRDIYAPLGLEVHTYSKLITGEQAREADRMADAVGLDAMKHFVWNGIRVGEHALAGTIRFYASTDLKKQAQADQVAARYLSASMLTAYAALNLLEAFPFTAICGSHGIYVPQGLLGEVARRRSIRVIHWMPAYRDRCLIFSEGDTYHKTLLHEPNSVWEDMRWSEAHEQETMDYLASRQYGARDWISFHREPAQDSIKQLKRMGVDFQKPCIGLLTNVSWDAQLHYGKTPFADMSEWLMETVRYFAKRPDLQLIIRIHPAEIKGLVRSRQPAAEDIAKACDELPENIFVIPPESAISTYETMERCESVIIYATKTGIELSARGIPVIVAGEAWIKNKGFAYDAGSKEEYFEILARLPLRKKLDRAKVRRARMYAYHFFMRRMIPLESFHKKYDCSIHSLTDLRPGACEGLDIICDGILDGTGFVYPHENTVP